MTSNALDIQEGGGHYKKLKIQPIEYIHANTLDFFQGNIIKYATRHHDKNGAEDLRKVIHYAQLALQLQYREGLNDKPECATPLITAGWYTGDILKDAHYFPEGGVTAGCGQTLGDVHKRAPRAGQAYCHVCKAPSKPSAHAWDGWFYEEDQIAHKFGSYVHGPDCESEIPCDLQSVVNTSTEGITRCPKCNKG